MGNGKLWVTQKFEWRCHGKFEVDSKAMMRKSNVLLT